jgi:adenine C2-methylase RlmN of 23S rRNA A2503 and tRNA A37
MFQILERRNFKIAAVAFEQLINKPSFIFCYSQVGCAMACSFCATGQMGLTGNLSYTEVLEQVIHAEIILAQEALERRTLQSSVSEEENSGNRKTKNNQSKDLDIVRNIVFMGMGFV